MKRHNDLFSKITDIDNIRLAYQKARKGKSKKSAVRRFESGNVEEKLLILQQSLINKTFTTSLYTTKTLYEPKERTIYVLPFYPDRIVQHAIMNILEPIWDKLFIHDSYACRVGKGIHKGSQKTMEFVRKYKYCLKCDISKFYPSINHDILYKIIQRKIKCKDTLWLLKDIIYSIQGNSNVPIGNYTSQWFGNLYLNELDTYLKHTEKIKAYIRYCDDFLLFHNNKSSLYKISLKIQDFVWFNLKLILSKCDLFRVTRGVDFLGYRHFPDYILLRKSTAKRIVTRFKTLPKKLHEGRILFDSCISSIASTIGWMKWCNSNNLSVKLNLVGAI